MTGEKWCIEGIKAIMNLSFSGTSATERLELFFFSNDANPSVSSTNTDFTELGTSTGFGRVELNKASFSNADVTTGTSSIVYTMYNGTTGLAFTSLSSFNMYGYAIRSKTLQNIYYVKNVGLHAMQATDIYTINPLQLQMEI